MKAFIATLVVLMIANMAAVDGKSLLGTARCTFGPSYWCASLQKSKECSATQHCIKNYWNKELKGSTSEVSVSSTTVCDYCKDMIQDVKNFVESNKTMSTIRDYMKKACGFMPDDFAQTECNKVAEHYLEEFLDLVKSGVDPEKICQLILLCPKSSSSASKSIKQLMLQPAKVRLTGVVGVRDTPECIACKSAVQTAKSLVDNPKYQAAMKIMLEAQCQKLGTDLAAECKLMVDMVLPQLISVLDKELTDQLCAKFHLCTNATSIDVVKMAKTTFINLLKESKLKSYIVGIASRVNADACTTCEEVVNYIKIFVSNNQTEQEVMNVIENDVCTELGEFSSLCKEVVAQYFPDLWTKFLSALEAKSLCTEIGLCNATSSVTVQGAVAPVKKLPKARASVECVICEFVMSKLKSEISDNATEEEIVAVVEKVCTLLPSTIKTECDKLIEKYGKAIIHLLVNDASPSVICTFLGLCGSGDNMYKMALSNVAGENCIMCELAMTYLKSMLTKKATEQEILQELERVCNFLSGKYAQQCNTMIETDGPKLLQLVAEGLNGKEICTKVGLCSAGVRKVDGLVHLYNLKRSDNI